jgi:hypothetical protein
MKLTTADIIAQVKAFTAECRTRGVTIERCQPTSTVLTLSKTFTPGDKAAYCKAEGDVGIIYTVRQTEPGSTWGTDSGSIGGHVGITQGCMRLNRSGCSKRWLSELQKEMSRS